MEWCKIRVFGKDEEEIIDTLRSFGISKNISSVIIFLIIEKEGTSREIEISARLRQPEVSSAIQYLSTKNWVSVKQKKGRGRGRPRNLYKLDTSLEDILHHFKERNKTTADEIEKCARHVLEISERF